MGQVNIQEAKHPVLLHRGKGAQVTVVVSLPKVDLVVSKALVN